MPESSQAVSGTTRSRANGLSAPILLLNRHYAPVSVTTARRGMVLLFGGAALALDELGASHDFSKWRTLPVRETDDLVPIVGGQLRIPRVLHLLRYDRAPRFGVRLTRRNLLLRDAYRCQYCGEEPGVRELNVDHVMPRSRGGRDSWDNLVISCRRCNLRKGKRTPDEANMQLLRKPVKPGWSTAAHIVLTTRAPFSEWRPFLGAS
ncbi:MAG TPA: HNH endonuclease [Polyangiaceae bacterium]|nr:HNH endonuclease [Polyangiaceae bacterium]